MIKVTAAITNIRWDTSHLDVDQDDQPIGVPPSAMNVSTYLGDFSEWLVMGSRIITDELQNETGVSVRDYTISVVTVEEVVND